MAGDGMVSKAYNPIKLRINKLATDQQIYLSSSRLHKSNCKVIEVQKLFYMKPSKNFLKLIG